ncbi:MAG: NAD-dependent epimerase/dehydratase family protein [Patescibacteria group bacterium]
MKHKTILVTGGAGFIGSNLAISFKRKYPKLNVISLDNLKRRGSELNLSRLKEANIKFIHADIRCQEDLIFSNKKIDLLIECSAEPSVLAGFGENPNYIINTNLLGTINCLELARKNNSDIIFLSTSRVYPYGLLNGIRVKELNTRFEWLGGQKIKGYSKEGIGVDFPTNGPKTLYGATKLCSEIILEEYIKNYGLKGVINRCGVIAGPWQFGKVDQGIFTFLMMAHYFKRDIKFIGFGGKGKQVRDVLHVDDLFDLIDLEASCLNKISGNIYNIGGGRNGSLSLLEAAHLCQQITGNKLNITKETINRPGDIAIYLSDNRKVYRDLSWKPTKTPKQIFSEIYEWICVNKEKITTSLL